MTAKGSAAGFTDSVFEVLQKRVITPGFAQENHLIPEVAAGFASAQVQLKAEPLHWP